MNGYGDVAIVGYGMARFSRGECSDHSLYELAVTSTAEMLNELDIRRDGIDALIVSTTDGRAYTASILADMLGIRARVVQRVESMCSSGASALMTAYTYIASGLCDTALVIGFDAYDSGMLLGWDVARGDARHPAHWAAMYAKRHMQEFGTRREQLAMVAVKNRSNALGNEKAYFHNSRVISVDDVINSRPVVEPLRLYDCSIACNGAASLLLASADRAKGICREPVWIKGIGSSSVGASISNIDLARMDATIDAARQAYRMSGVEPRMVDTAQVHDSFTILEVMAYEDLGFVRKGEGGYAAEGKVSIPAINTDGGVLGRGHSSGATGVAQVVEIARQLMHRAGSRQVRDCSIGLVHNMAAAGTHAGVIILSNQQ
ncbi:MAG: thiolase family protein [Candidatus Nitrosocaldus sp.]|nr:thiolase family protein [Candidatus Nitrosocaldus sp.]MDW8276060.1 thiolase family protein [Candidatus Nitrosocaldus sp.]